MILAADDFTVHLKFFTNTIKSTIGTPIDSIGKPEVLMADLQGH